MFWDTNPFPEMSFANCSLPGCGLSLHLLYSVFFKISVLKKLS